MNELLNPVSCNCTFCGNPTRPKITPRKEPSGQVLQEAKWICPQCGNLFKQGIVKAPTDKYSIF